jgi:hypothetical protein
VTVSARVGKTLQHHQTGALRPDGAVGGSREWLAPGVGSQPPLVTELHEHAGARHHRDAAGQGHAAFALAQCLGG